MAFGIFTGMMPIMPFQMALAVSLAVLFKGSKIAAALGTWVSNPLNWYFLYYLSYKVGASLLGLQQRNATFASIMGAVRADEPGMMIAEKIMHAGGLILAAFLLGGFLMGLAAGAPAYFIFLFLFRRIHQWRRNRKQEKSWETETTP